MFPRNLHSSIGYLSPVNYERSKLPPGSPKPITAHETGATPMSDFGTIRAALKTDRTIDIVTIGAKTNSPRETEIWFTNIDGRIIICGTPAAKGKRGPRARRHWLANLIANPEFQFRLKESIEISLPARATVVRQPAGRRAIMSAAQTQWYRDQGYSLDELVDFAPIVDVMFTGPYAALNTKVVGSCVDGTKGGC